MNTDLRTFAERVRALEADLRALDQAARHVGVGPLAGRQWFELLRHKLLAQLDSRPLLVAAIVGGTNIGKSVIFNHLAGEVASGVSPLAAGTRHPVCLVPPGADDAELLARWFEPFALRSWRSAQDPLEDSAEDRLFWRVAESLPERLLVIDAPDVDSDVEVNWQRAQAIREVADVLLAVLTQQKYNDAAVKQFFRAAVETDKPIVVLFNKCDLEHDRHWWPRWLETFCDETGAQPELVYVIPEDRRAAERLRLPFYAVGPDGEAAGEQPVCLRDELAALHFDAIKIRTFRGALSRVLEPGQGLPAWQDEVRRAAGEHQAAAEALSARQLAQVAWPTLPARVLVDEIRQWWDDRRSDWSRRVHGFYRVLGRGLTWPVRKAVDQFRGAGEDPLDRFRQREREAIIAAMQSMFDQLERLAKVGNDTLRPRLRELLSGDARRRLLERIGEVHAQQPAVDEDYRRFLYRELDTWCEANPRAVGFLRSLDHAMALARPAITVSLAVVGWGLAGDLVGQAATQAAGQTMGHLAAEAAIAGGVTGGGEALVSTTSEGVRQAAGRLFARLQLRYTHQRAQWLADWLEEQLLGQLLGELRQGAELPKAAAFEHVEQSLAALRELAPLDDPRESSGL